MLLGFGPPHNPPTYSNAALSVVRWYIDFGEWFGVVGKAVEADVVLVTRNDEVSKPR